MHDELYQEYMRRLGRKMDKINKLYYDEGEWVTTSKKKREAALASQPPDKQIVELRKLLEASENKRKDLNAEIDRLGRMQRETHRQLKNLQKIEAAFHEQSVMIETQKKELEVINKEKDKAQGKVDGAMERAMIAEIDVAEIKHKNELKDGMFRSLRGFFGAQSKGFFFQKQTNRSFNQWETKSILEIIDKGLNTDKIKCPKV